MSRSRKRGRVKPKDWSVCVAFSKEEHERLAGLAQAGSVTVEEYIRACVLGPRCPSPPELLAEVLRRGLEPTPLPCPTNRGTNGSARSRVDGGQVHLEGVPAGAEHVGKGDGPDV